MTVKRVAALIVISLLGGCAGDDNVADCEKGRKPVPCSARSADEDARLALDDHDYDRAIELLASLVEEEPETYERYPLLAAAYAGRGGIAILDIINAQSAAGGGSLLDALATFLPSPSNPEIDYPKALADVAAANEILRRIPAASLADTELAYGNSARLQLTLYQSAYSVMYLNQFTISAATGQVDLNQLENMTAADAVVILQNLSQAATLQQGEQGAAIQAKVNQALADIQGQNGETDLEKLKEFVRKEQAPALQ